MSEDAAASNPRYLRKLAEQVREFERKFSHLIELGEFTARLVIAAGPDLPDAVKAGYASLPALVPAMHTKSDHWAKAKAQCALAAGRIAHVPKISGVLISLPNRAMVNPFEAWITVTQSSSGATPDDILAACEHTIGTLEAIADREDIAADIRIEDMHPLVWGAARGQWRIGLYREAVGSAVSAVIDHVRQLTGRTDLDEKDVLIQAFSSNAPKPNEPRLRWPGNEQDQNVRSMNRGLAGFATGVQAAIRNVTTHDRTPLTPQQAAERLATLSLMATWVEQCRIDHGDRPVSDEEPGPAAEV